MNPHPNNEPTTGARRLRSSLARLAMPALLVTTLVLSLCFEGCALFKTREEILPSVHQASQGNAVLATMPAGTVVKLPFHSARITAAFANETLTTSNSLTLMQPLLLVTPAYIAERDAIEMSLRSRVAELEAKGAR